jgi:hypothetical protein
MTQAQIVQVKAGTKNDIVRIGSEPAVQSPVLVNVALVSARAEHRLAWDSLRQLDKLPVQRNTVPHRRAAERYNETEITLAQLEKRKPRLMFASDWRTRNEAEASNRLRRW